jgi:phosphoribosylanthranilate isomerase
MPFLLGYRPGLPFLLIIMRTRVKICGITRPEDGQAAARAGADAVGLVFYDRSSRFVDLERARAVCAVLPPFVSVVGLFVNPTREDVTAVLAALPVALLQFHGNESVRDCEGFDRPYIKAIPMRPDTDPLQVMDRYPGAAGFLLDAYHPDVHGGGGTAFDWIRWPHGVGRPLILAGGLTPENVATAVASTRPYAVDVSSGVELSGGIKSTEKMEAFMRGVERGDASEAGG